MQLCCAPNWRCIRLQLVAWQQVQSNVWWLCFPECVATGPCFCFLSLRLATNLVSTQVTETGHARDGVDRPPCWLPCFKNSLLRSSGVDRCPVSGDFWTFEHHQMIFVWWYYVIIIHVYPGYPQLLVVAWMGRLRTPDLHAALCVRGWVRNPQLDAGCVIPAYCCTDS